MSPGRDRIFVSSTSDLRAEREALRDQLSRLFNLSLHEMGGAQGISPKEWCETEISKSHVFLCILGNRYGSVYQESDGEELSIVELEFRTARKLQIEIMTFIKVLDEGTEIDPRQQRFIDRVTDFGEGVFRGLYHDVDELVRNATRSLLEWSLEFKIKLADKIMLDRAWVRKIVTPLPFVMALVGLPVAAVLFTQGLVGVGAFLGFCACAAAFIALCWVLLQQ